MHDPAGDLGDPQHEVVVLRAVVPLAEAADAPDHLGADDREVAGVHLAAQPLRRPVGLAEQVVEAAGVVDLVLVGVEVVDVVVRGDLGGVAGQGGAGRAGRRGRGARGTRRSPPRSRRWTPRRCGRWSRARRPGCAGRAAACSRSTSRTCVARGEVVDQDQLPVVEVLGQDRRDGLAEDVERGVVDGRDDREERRGGQGSTPALGQEPARGARGSAAAGARAARRARAAAGRPGALLLQALAQVLDARLLGVVLAGRAGRRSAAGRRPRPRAR